MVDRFLEAVGDAPIYAGHFWKRIEPGWFELECHCGRDVPLCNDTVEHSDALQLVNPVTGGISNRRYLLTADLQVKACRGTSGCFLVVDVLNNFRRVSTETGIGEYPSKATLSRTTSAVDDRQFWTEREGGVVGRALIPSKASMRVS